MGLGIFDLYNKTNDSIIDSASSSTNSSLQVKCDYEKVETDTEWLVMMEDTIRYLDNILRNPNRFIVNEEEIVKIELARKVTVESIKHLSRNTNLIQDYDKKTGDVKPSKILNINKEESFNTYENRFIYSLIQNMKIFINRKKSMGIADSSLKDNKSFLYSGSARVGNESVKIQMQMDSKLSTKIDNNGAKNEFDLGNDNYSLSERIERLEMRITDLTNTEVYKTLARLHVALVTSPIKKTNVILKNVNFQYAEKLWNYMQENMDDKTRRDKDNKSYQDNGELKSYLDDTFMLNYLVMNTLSKNNVSDDVKTDISDRVIGNAIEQIISLNSNVTEQEIKNIVGKQYEVIKYKYVTSEKRIIEIFDKYTSKYLKRVNHMKI